MQEIIRIAKFDSELQWDDGSGKRKSVKYAWKDANGKVARGGEIPVESLPQMLEFAIRKGYLALS